MRRLSGSFRPGRRRSSAGGTHLLRRRFLAEPPNAKDHRMKNGPDCNDMDQLICFSHLRWNFVHQRPQHLLTRAAQHLRVHYFEEPEIVQHAEARLRMEVRDGIIRLVPETPHDAAPISLQRRLLQSYLRQLPHRFRIGWFYTPLALRFANPAAFDFIVYDCMDELSGFHGADPDMQTMERRLFQAADLVFTGGASLFESKRTQHHNVRLEPSSVDAAHFAMARTWADGDPADQAQLPRPRIGWFGVIDERMDLELVAKLADLRPAWAFVMLGPVVKIDPDTLPRRPNLHWLGPKPYAELPKYLAGWDCGFMPFARNAATRFMSPTKTPEYLAAGVPLVSTPIPDVVSPWGEAGLVEIAADVQPFVGAVERTMRQRSGDWLALADRSLASLSWDRTWARMSAAIRGARVRSPQALSPAVAG